MSAEHIGAHVSHQPLPRKRTYWGDKVPMEGRIVVERLRRRYISGYAEAAERGFRTVDDIPETRRGVLKELTRQQLFTTLLQGAHGRIRKLEEEDASHGRHREYDSFVGAFRPRRGVKWSEISSEEDLRWQPEGVTIVARQALRVHMAASAVAVRRELVSAGPFAMVQ